MQFIFQKKILILSIVFFLFSCFVFLFLYKIINDNKKALQLAQEKWQTETTRKENTESITNLIRKIEPERTLLETHFVQGSDVVPFLNTIEKLAQEVKVEAEVVSVDVEKNDNSSLMIEMKTLGNFESIYKLIMLLENSPYDLEFLLVNIQNLSVQDTSTNKIPQWTAAFKIRLKSFVN